MKKIYLCLIVYITALTVSAAAEQTPSTHSWVDLSQYSGDEAVKTVTRADLKQLMYEFQNDRMAVAALNNDPQSVKQEEAAGAYTRLSTPP